MANCTKRSTKHKSQSSNNAVNEGISKEDHSVQYSSFDDATNSIKDTGHHALLSKLDIANAFRIIPVKPEEWVLLGMYWEGHYFVDCHLPFGSRSSPFIFNVFADLLTWIIQSQICPNIIIHYLDDFLCIVAKNNVPIATQALKTRQLRCSIG